MSTIIEGKGLSLTVFLLRSGRGEENMPKIILDVEKCKGCGYCIQVCPKKIISFGDKFNKEGYKFIQINESECIGCGTCHTICPDSVMEIYNNVKE